MKKLIKWLRNRKWSVIYSGNKLDARTPVASEVTMGSYMEDSEKYIDSMGSYRKRFFHRESRFLISYNPEKSSSIIITLLERHVVHDAFKKLFGTSKLFHSLSDCKTMWKRVGTGYIPAADLVKLTDLICKVEEETTGADPRSTGRFPKHFISSKGSSICYIDMDCTFEDLLEKYGGGK